jgi:hypothetical protein
MTVCLCSSRPLVLKPVSKNAENLHFMFDDGLSLGGFFHQIKGRRKYVQAIQAVLRRIRGLDGFLY